MFLIRPLLTTPCWRPVFDFRTKKAAPSRPCGPRPRCCGQCRQCHCGQSGRTGARILLLFESDFGQCQHHCFICGDCLNAPGPHWRWQSENRKFTSEYKNMSTRLLCSFHDRKEKALVSQAGASTPLVCIILQVDASLLRIGPSHQAYNKVAGCGFTF